MGKGGTEINYPQQQSYGESLRDSLTAQIDLAPELFAAEASQQYGRPAYAQLETDILKDTLLGQQRWTPDEGAMPEIQPMPAGQAPAGAGAPDWASMAPSVQQAQTDQMRALYQLGTQGLARREGDPNWADSISQEQLSALGQMGYIDPEITKANAYQPQVQEQVAQGVQQWMRDSGREGDIGQLDAFANINQLDAGGIYDTWAGSRGQVAQPQQQAGGVIPMDRPVEGDFMQAYMGGMTQPQREQAATWAENMRSGAFTPEQLVREFGVPAELAQRAPTMTDDELSRLHYDYYGKGEGYSLPVAGEMGRGGGLLEMMGGAEAGYRDGEFQGLATFGSDVAAESARRQRESDIQDVTDMAPDLRSAMEAADPIGATLLTEMGAQAENELKARGDLTPRERRMAEQAARKAWTQRGLVRDPQAVVDELSSLEDAQRLRKAERRGFAQQVMGASKTMGADPFMAILGRPSGAGQQVAQSGIGTAGYGLTAGPGVVFNPEAGLSYMLGQQQNQANLAAAQASANATRSAGMAGGLGALGGGIAQGAIIACWVAREVYGEDNPKWEQFRHWMLNKSPVWFREWYLTHGEFVAEWLKDKPELKSRIKVFMDSKLEA